MIINHNIAALNTHRQMGSAQSAQAESMEKLSSGLRINSASDDAAGLTISEKMRGQIRGLEQGSRNAQDGISMIQTAEGALSETQDILQRMRELAVQSANDTNTDTDRGEIQKEVDQLAEEITRISNTTEFNNKSLLNGAVKEGNLGKTTFQIGANSGQNLGLEISAMDAFSLGVGRNVTTSKVQAGATDVTSASLNPTTGSGVLNGSTLTLDADAIAAKATAGVGTNFETANSTSKYNGYTVTVATGAGANSFQVDNDNKTISIALDTTAGASATAATNYIQGQTGGADFAFSAAPAAGNGTLGGGLAADETKLSLTSGGETESVIVKNNASNVSFKDPAKFAGVTLTLDGSVGASTSASIKIDTTAAGAATFANNAKTADAVSAGGIDVSSQSAADTAITFINNAIENVSSQRTKLGSVQNRLDHTINNLNTSAENLTAAESRIRDVDYAEAA